MISTQRIITFLFGCILTRTILVFLAYYFVENKYHILKNIFILVCFLIGLSMLLIYFGIGRERADKQLQGWKDDDPILWWNDLRPLHGSFYILFAILTAIGCKHTWIILLIDVLIGLIAWSFHHNFIIISL